MIAPEALFCPNPGCEHHGLTNHGNIRIVRLYGVKHDRRLLGCRTCGKSFAETRNTPLFGLHLSLETIASIARLAAEGVGVRATARKLELSPRTVSRIIVKVGEHREYFLKEALKGAPLTEAQLDEISTFVQKNKKKASGNPEDS